MDFDLPTGLAVLERTPATLRAMLSGLSSGWIDGTEGPDTWSPYAVLTHLTVADRTVWTVRAKMIVAQGPDRLFPSFVRLPEISETDRMPLPALLDDFAHVREESLRMLRDWRLTESQLQLEGEHPVFGRVTLQQLLAAWVAHDLQHVAQIVRVMAKQYRDAVGPWREYLTIMDR